MDDNNNDVHPSVIPELDELEALILVMLSADMTSISHDSRSHLLALAHRVVSTALDKAHGGSAA